MVRKIVDDLLGEADADDAGTDRQHVGVVVLAGHAGGVEAVAQRGAHAAHLVGGELLALAAAAEHDADVGVAVADRPADAGADRRVVDRLGRVGALVVDHVALAEQHRDEVLLEFVAGVVGADGDALSRCSVSVIESECRTARPTAPMTLTKRQRSRCDRSPDRPDGDRSAPL